MRKKAAIKSNSEQPKASPKSETSPPHQSIDWKSAFPKRHWIFLNSASDMIFLKDENFRHVIANKALQDFFGKTEDEVIGKTDFELMPEASARRCRETDEEALAIGQIVIHAEIVGDKIYETRKFPVDLGGGRQGIGGFIRDITLSKQTEKALRISEERLSMAMEAASDGMWDWNFGDNTAYFSPRYYTMLGYAPQEFPATLDSFLKAIHPDDRDAVEAVIRKYTADKQPGHEVEFRMQAKDGSHRWILSRGKVFLRDSNGVPLRIVGTHVDITDRKRTEQELKEALQEKEVLLREIHHRVKNNLQIISSLLRLQSRSIHDQEMHDIFNVSQARIQSMALIHEKLYQSQDLSRVDLGDYIRILATQLFSISGTNSEIVRMEMRLERAELDINRAIPCGLIVNELVSNSLKYAFPAGRKGLIRIEWRAIEDGKHLLAVTDDGVGLPQDLDLDNPKTLGLQIVTDLIRQLDGTFKLKREAGTSISIIF